MKKLEAVLVPAYGKHYVSNEDMYKGWESGKDFRICATGQYTSIRDTVILKEKFDRVVLTKDYCYYKVL